MIGGAIGNAIDPSWRGWCSPIVVGNAVCCLGLCRPTTKLSSRARCGIQEVERVMDLDAVDGVDALDVLDASLLLAKHAVIR